MSETTLGTWEWAELDPATRSVVAGFSGHIGDEAQGDLSGEKFIEAMTEAFEGVDAEDVTKTQQWGGSYGIRNLIINQLFDFGKQEVLTVTHELGRIAGGSEAVRELSKQAGEQITNDLHYKAMPALRVLSELAVSNR